MTTDKDVDEPTQGLTAMESLTVAAAYKKLRKIDAMEVTITAFRLGHGLRNHS